MKRGPQQRARAIHCGYLIKAERIFGWLIGFEIIRIRDEYAFANGHSDERVSVRMFVKYLKAWLDKELATIADQTRAAAA